MQSRKFVFALCAALPLTSGSAQGQTALEDAQHLDACDGGKVVRAKRMRDGSLKVKCSRSAQSGDETPPNVTPGATNVVGLLIPALGLGAAAAAAAGASSSPSSTSSTGQN